MKRAFKQSLLPCVACLAIALAFKATAGATPPGAKVSVKPAAKAANPPSSKLAPAKPAPGKATPASATPAPPKPKPEPTPPVPPDFLPTMLNGPLAGVEDIVFSVRTPGKNGHWYANFGYFIWGPQMPLYGERGRLCRYNLRTKQLTLLVDDPQGAVRDPQVHYDAKKILFSYRKGGETVYHLYEINVDGSDLRQLTDGAYDDIESTYLPNGDIMLVSARCKRWVNCFLTPVATLHVCDANGMNIRMISSNNEHDNSPWPLPDGRIVYTRWEYVDRSQLDFHHLWTMNPDGTNQAVYFGNMYPSYVMIDAKPIPRTNKVVAVFCPQHGRIEHMGEVRIVDPTKGPDEQGFARRITPADRIEFRDPYPITADCFLVARGGTLVAMDDQGRFDTIYSLPPNELKAGLLCQEPRPIVPRKREPVIPARVDPDETTGRVILADVRYGRNMEGVAPGEIKKLLVLETLPMPAHYQGGMRPITAGGSFTLERVLGTIPVEPDGSAYAELPAMRSLFFVALDENDLSLKRMQSFMTLQPGETLGCTGCHESRTLAPARLSETTLQALRRAPSAIEPVEGAPDVIDFPRDVQPILDRHCVSCHDWNRREGRVTLSGDRGPIYSHSYFTLTTRGYVVDGRNKPRGNRPPRTIGSGASPLMKFIDGSHYGATLSKAERDTIRLWIDSGAAYPGTYAALGTGSMADTYFLPKYDWTASPVKVTGGYEGFRADAELASGPDALKVIQTRCGRCHKGDTRVPARPSDLMEGKPLTAHLVFDLTVPERSLILTAPLAKQAGGLAERPATAASELVGKGKGCVAVFAGADDPGYQALLTEIRDCKGILDRMKRFDLPGFRPREEYIREMKRYGFLPETLGPGDPIDVYATERKYWESFWLKPPAQTASAEKAGTAEH